MGYVKVHVNLTKHQENKIKKAIANKTSVKLRLGSHNLHSASGSILMITENQYSKLQDGNMHDITIPFSRLVKHGGFLPFILPILAGLASAAGIAGGVATTVAKAKEAQKYGKGLDRPMIGACGC